MKHSGARSPGRTGIAAGLPGATRRSRGLRAAGAVCLRNVPGGDLPCGRRVRAGRRDEDRLTVVPEFQDALPDVRERPVTAVLRWAREIGARVPAPGQLLDARYVDHPVMKEGIQLRHVPVDEGTVRGDGIAAQRHFPRLGYVPADVAEHLLLRSEEHTS